MLAVVHSVALAGVEAHPVRVEVALGGGLPRFDVVGQPDTAVREAHQRVRSAVIASGFEWPKQRITVNLAPADLPKRGPWFDLPIALGILAAGGQLDPVLLERVLVVGELALNGTVRPVRAALGAAIAARRREVCAAVPLPNAAEAATVPGLDVRPIEFLADVRAWPDAPAVPPLRRDETPPPLDLGDVAGHTTAKFALTVAAAGGHHCLLVGEPGAGKTMLARRLPGLLPPMSELEALEVSQVHAIAGLGGIVTERPFRSPHHSASNVAIVGGGAAQVSIGEATLASGGVLFLDELGEFRPHVLDSLRQPLEDGTITIARKDVRHVLPAQFQLVASSNPCPCGFAGSQRHLCRCAESDLARYRRRLSGPLLDRLDLTVPVAPVPTEVLLAHVPVGESADRRAQVVAARARQAARQGEVLNARLDSTRIGSVVDATGAVGELLGRLATGMSSRGVRAVQRVARTIADLEGVDGVEVRHVEAAWRLRLPAAFGRAPGPGRTPAASGASAVGSGGVA